MQYEIVPVDGAKAPSKDTAVGGVDADTIRINIGSNYAQRGSAANIVNLGINARRSGSASVLVRDDKGGIKVERKNTQGDLGIALTKRLSQSSLPSIFPEKVSTAQPVINAEDALERIGGKGAAGAFSEHMYPLETLAENFQVFVL